MKGRGGLIFFIIMFGFFKKMKASNIFADDNYFNDNDNRSLITKFFNIFWYDCYTAITK